MCDSKLLNGSVFIFSYIPRSIGSSRSSSSFFSSKKIADDILEDLDKAGMNPKIIGKVLGKENGTVYVNNEIEKFIHRKNILLKYFKTM